MQADNTNTSASTFMDAQEFNAEQAHLSEVYTTLTNIAQSVAAKLELNRHEAAQEIEDMAAEIAPNFATEADAFETYSEYATANNLISTYNIAQDAALERFNKITLLLKQPYFAKIVLQFKPSEPTKALYLGVAGATDDNYKRLVVDWRSPVAELYYNQEMGPTNYFANGKTIAVDLKQRRQFDITRNKLHAYFDTNIAIEDELLLQSLSAERSAHMQHITATIQKEQNEVIRHSDTEALLVTGIAGSGKTSVLLQRIAYLLYHNRTHVKAEEVYLISPNKVFSKYIEQVLPSLGEKNPETITWDDFAKQHLPFGRSLRSCLGSTELLDKADKLMEQFHFEEADVRDITINGVRLIAAKQIVRLMEKYSHIAPGPHLVTLVREDLFARLEAKLAQMASSEAVQNEVMLLPLNDQVSLFNGPYDPQNEDEARQMARTYLNKRFEGAICAIEADEWVRIDRIGMRILGIDNLPSTLWLYLKCALTGMCNSSAKYVIVDEVQDYTSDQIALLKKYFKNAHFMLMGDPYQAIRPECLAFDSLSTIFEGPTSKLEKCELTTSYRSTPSITKLFTQLLPENARNKIQTVRRADEAPTIKAFSSAQDYEQFMRQRVIKANTEGGLTAIIAPWKQELNALKRMLGEACPTIVDGRRMLPTSGCILLTLAQAKGLEFDTVIIPNATSEVFKNDSLSRNRLYTSVSRANKRLEIYSNGPLTELLNMSFDQ